MPDAGPNLMEIIWENGIALIAIYGAILSTIQVYLRIQDNKKDIKVEIFKSYKKTEIRSEEDDSLGKIPIGYWRIIARNYGQKSVVIYSFWLTLQHDSKEEPFFDEPKNKSIVHDEGTISLPYEITPRNNLSIALNGNYFDSFFKDRKTLNLDNTESKFKLIAYFEDNLGKKYKSKAFEI